MENGSTIDDTVDINSSSNGQDYTANVEEIGNFVKCHKAIQEVCLRAANCVKNVLDGWHKRMRKGEFGIKKCTSPSKCKKVKGGACLNCANWVNEIEKVVFPNDEKTIDGLCWRNVKSQLFETGSLQVAKLFVYNTPEERISKIKDFTMFDGGSLLMIMKTFSEFLEDDHQRADKNERQDDESASMFTSESSESGSTPSSDSAELKRKQDYAHTIDEVLQIRNRLCHIDVGSKLQIPDEEMEEYFTNIRRLVFNMESLGHFKKRECKDINTSLSKMSREKVTADMIEATRHQLISRTSAENFETAIKPLTILQQNIGTVVQQAGKFNTYKYVDKEIHNHYHVNNDKNGLCMLTNDEAKDSPRKHQQGMNAVGNVPYNQVKGDVEDSLPPDKLKKIKRLLLVDPDLGFGISRESVNRIENNEDLMNCLEDHKLLGPYNLVFLPILLLLVNCDELKNKFDDLAEHMRTRNNVDPLSLCKVGTKIENNFLVELKIQGDRKYLRGYDIETFRRRLASQLLIEEQNVRFEAAGLGCFVIVFILPEKVRSTLRLAATERAKWLQEAEIIGVHIEDEDYISLLDTDNANAYDDHPEHFDDDKSETLSHLTSVPEENDSVSGTQQDVQAKKTETQHKEEKSLQNTQESMPQTEAMNFEDAEFRELAEIRDLKENWEVVADNMGFNKQAKDLLWNEGNGHEDDHCISIVVYNMLTKWQATQPQVLDFRKALSKVLEKSGLHDLAEHVLHPVENRGLTTVTSKTIEEPDADDITSGKDFENIEEPWEGFQAQVEDILDRKHRFLQFKTKLPAFKKSVRKLQEDMAKMAKKLKVLAFKYRKQHQMNIVSGNHLFASLNLASHAIQMYIDCGVNSGLAIKLLLHRAECAIIMCNYFSNDLDRKHFIFIVKENTKAVLEQCGKNEKAKEGALVIQLLAGFLEISDRSSQERAFQSVVKRILSLRLEIQMQSAIETAKTILEEQLSPSAWKECHESKPTAPEGSDSGLGTSISTSDVGHTDGYCSSVSSKTSTSKRSNKKKTSKKQKRQELSSVDKYKDTGHPSRKRATSTSTSRSKKDLDSEISFIAASDSARSEELYCEYCQTPFSDTEEKERHATTTKHKHNVSRLKGPFKHREPPPNIRDGKYFLCKSKPISTCPFADACSKAHSEDELKEWQERFELQQEQMANAVRNKLHSYLDDVLLQYRLATDQDSVLTEFPEKISKKIKISCQEELQVNIVRQNDDIEGSNPETSEWCFTVETFSEKPLKVVGLLHDEHRSSFRVSTPGGNTKEILTSKQLPEQVMNSENESDKRILYDITVSFSSRMLGEFHQWVLFDFGDNPKVVKKLKVRVVDMVETSTRETLQHDSLLQSHKWDWSKYDLIPFKTGGRYWSNNKENATLTKSQIPTAPLNKENYKKYMRHLLNVEEEHRLELLKRYGMQTDMKVVKEISITKYKYCTPARKDMLFGAIDLSKHPLDDTQASQIILDHVEYIRIKFDNRDVIYEAAIYNNLNLDEMKTPDTLYVELSPSCVEQLGLDDGDERTVQIQFELERRYFQTMREAVEELDQKSLHFLFPPQNPNPALISPRTMKATSKSLNKWQECAARFIRNRGGNEDTTPLLLMYGPFGSGKTYTLAKTAMQILRENKPFPRPPKILICTHSNSAADIYITQYFADFMEHRSNLMICRVYATSHDLRNIPSEVKKFCNLDNNGRLSIQTSNILKCNLVVTTTTTAARLPVEQFRDKFTHILIDEAAQVLETEAIIPLRLATFKTCVVLAGDHRQMAPKVYSQEAKAKEFHHSLLQRVIEHSIQKDYIRYVQFTRNYRTQKDILSFLSQKFYNGIKFVPGKRTERIKDCFPLEFRAVIGQEHFTGKSCENELEAQEVSKRIESLKPLINADTMSIGVLTPYTLQVRRIRQILREKNIQGVTVERVQNVQGKQYDIIILSTVRTQETTESGNQSISSDDYLGFLSDWRQLNTAFTRAQSLIIVIGNPKTLCSVGKCCIIWKHYVEICEKNGSLYPTDFSLDDIHIHPQIIHTLGNTTPSHADTNLARSKLFSRQMSDTWTPDKVMPAPVSKDQKIDFDSLEETNKEDLILKFLATQIGDDELDMATAMVEESDAKSKKERCIFRVDFDRQMHAVSKYPKASKKIIISTNTQRKTALDGDEVDVEVFTNAKSEQELQEYGKVVEVVNRHQKMEGKEVVCYPDPFSDNLMVPFDQYLPKIIIAMRKEEKDKRKNQNEETLEIPIYKLRYHDEDINSQSSRYVKYDFDRYVEVKNQDRSNTLFVVQWLSWNEGYYYPLGYVVDCIAKSDGLDTLKRIYSIPRPLDDDEPSLDLLSLRRKYQIELTRRNDLTHQNVFTIDPPDTRDHDDALSIEETDDGYVVWIHVSDVSFYISKDSKLDQEARKRGTSFYPHKNEPIHMLPPELSTRLCSLIRGVDRLAISLSIPFEKSGKRCTRDTRSMKEKFQLTVINCKDNLYYEDVQQAIVCERKDGPFEDLLQLYKIASYQREQRLGLRKFAEHCDHQTMPYPQAHILVEEFMIMANQEVAIDLTKYFKNSTGTPLRRKQPPFRPQFLEWKRKNDEIIKRSLYLSSLETWLYSLSQSTFTYECNSDQGQSKVVAVLKHVWNEITTKGRKGKLDEVASLLCADSKHPEQASVLNELHHIMPKSEYVGSGDHKEYELSHKDLRLPKYTHYTSPIRRYIDLIVHRQLKQAIIANAESPFSQDEIREICRQSTIHHAKSVDFENKSQSLYLAYEVKQYPEQLLAFVESISENGFVLVCSVHHSICSALQRCEVKFATLKPFEEPTSLQDGQKMSLTWRERIYHVNINNTNMSKHDQVECRKRGTEKLLRSTRFIEHIPNHQWMRMLKYVSIGDKTLLHKTVADTEQALIQNQQTNQGSIKKRKVHGNQSIVQNEVDEIATINNPFVKFRRVFAIGDVIQVQLHSGLKKGIPTPRINLLNLTPQLDICLAHRTDPVSSFAEVVDKKPKRSNVQKYQKTWIPILEMESTYSTLQSNDSITVHGVKIDWLYPYGDLLPSGSFSFSKSFCSERNIRFYSPRSIQLTSCFLCIRYKLVRKRYSSDYSSKLENTSVVQGDSSNETFVAHAYVVDVDWPESICDHDSSGYEEPEEQTWTVYFKVHQCLSEFPSILTSPNPSSSQPYATIEIIQKHLPDRRIEEAVAMLHRAPALIQDICLHGQDSETDDSGSEQDDFHMDELKMEKADDISSQLRNLANSLDLNDHVEGSPFPKMNESQQRAVSSALLQPFTVIQGPPGTGKTVTGAYMVYFFTKLNSQLKFPENPFDATRPLVRPQVLYCGPSNKAVDVIAGYLRKFKNSLDHAHIPNNLSFIRVYSEQIEFQKYPIKDRQAPFPTQHHSLHDVKTQIEKDSLHYKMRHNRLDRLTQSILQFEQEFAPTSRNKPTDEQYETYRKQLKIARGRELKKYSVILSTCNTSAWKVVCQQTNIVECIIDEAGMCTEPETLVPLVSTEPVRVVLIGDHKQLRPIVQQQTAKQLGLDISLLESYSDQIEMLDTQYRMHKAICEFPSNEFYEGKLQTGKSDNHEWQIFRDWPGGQNCPIAFCHIEGHEYTVSVQTEEGNEKSKYNEDEVRQVKRITTTLIEQYRINPEKIAVLTQYRQQFAKLTEALQSNKKLRRVAVSTVIKSQGSEWDVVILSTVRTLPWYKIEQRPTRGWKKKYLGFITDENQMNVALTRAREGLVIVGNMNLLKTESHWANLIRHYDSKNCILRAREFLHKQ